MKNRLKLIKLEQKFESVTLQLEKLEIKRDLFISLNKDSSYIEDKIYLLEDKQYQIQLKIEEIEQCS